MNKLTEKQKNFILNNIEIIDNYTLQEIVEELIDNMSKKYATNLISNMMKDLKNVDYGDYESNDYGDR